MVLRFKFFLHRTVTKMVGLPQKKWQHKERAAAAKAFPFITEITRLL